MNYDSTSDTTEHIVRVADLLNNVIHKLARRARDHDASKLEEPEKSMFDEFTPKLAEMTYGSSEYTAALGEMGKALEHHYENNRHHPEHHVHGVVDMTLLDLIEMLCDWKAASERHELGNVYRSIEQNQVRFKISPQLTNILFNTAREMGWRT